MTIIPRLITEELIQGVGFSCSSIERTQELPLYIFGQPSPFAASYYHLVGDLFSGSSHKIVRLESKFGEDLGKWLLAKIAF